MFKISQVTCLAFGFLVMASENLFAQSITANTLQIDLTAPAVGTLCSTSSSGIPVEFNMTGSISISADTVRPTIQVRVQNLGSASTVACTANPSGILLLGSKDLTPSTGQTTINGTTYTAADFGTLNTSAFYSNICTTNQTQSYGLCIYVINRDATPLTASDWLVSSVTPPKILNTRTSGGSTTTAAVNVVSTQAGDQQIQILVSSNASINGFEICYAADPIDINFASSSSCLGNTVFIDGSVSGTTDALSTALLFWQKDSDGGRLVNGTSYRFRVRGGSSGWSNTVDATPVAGYSTLALYQGENGGLSWQCGQSIRADVSGPLLTLLSLSFLLLSLSAMRRRRFSLVLKKISLFAVIAGFTLPAQAFNLSLTGAPYKPNLDQGKDFQTYKCLYSDATLPLLGAGFDFHVADPFGSFQLGFGLGYSWANGSAQSAPASGTTCGTLLTGASVAFHTLQLRPRFTYVFDPYISNFPFAPYVRLGLVAAGYYFTYQGDPDTSGQPTKNPMGVKFGWEAGGGLMFLLDSLDPSVALRARGSGTYNHTYLVADIAYSSINDFGSAGYDLSPTGAFGSTVPLLFTFSLAIDF